MKQSEEDAKSELKTCLIAGTVLFLVGLGMSIATREWFFVAWFGISGIVFAASALSKYFSKHRYDYDGY